MSLTHSMRHRHLDTQEFTLPAIDDIIARGGNRDWIELRDAIRLSPKIAQNVKRICDHYTDTDEIRYHFWPVYLKLYGYGWLYEEK